MARRLSPEARRAEIVQTATELIATEGYRALSLREVARRCGMSAPGLMHHFPDMPSLLNAVLAHRDEMDIAAISGGQPEHASIDDLIAAASDHYQRRPDATLRFDALEAEAVDPSHPAHDYYLERDKRSLAKFRPFVEREYEDPDRVLLVVGIVFEGLRFRRLRDPEHVDMWQEWAAIKDAVLGTFRRRDAATATASASTVPQN